MCTFLTQIKFCETVGKISYNRAFQGLSLKIFVFVTSVIAILCNGEIVRLHMTLGIHFCILEPYF